VTEAVGKRQLRRTVRLFILFIGRRAAFIGRRAPFAATAAAGHHTRTRASGER